MAKFLIAKQNNKVISRYLLTPNNVAHIEAKVHVSYEVIDDKTGKLVKNIKVKSQEQDLVVELEGEPIAIIENFFDSTLETSYLSEEGIIDNNDQDDIPAAPPPPPPVGEAGAATAGSSSLPTTALTAAGVVGGGAVAVGVSSNDKKKTDTQSQPPAEETEETDEPSDTTSPTATISLSTNNFGFADMATVTITFSEAVSNLTLDDLNAENGTLSNLTTSDNITWTANFSADAGVNVANNTITLGTDYADEAGNQGTAATSDNYNINSTNATVVFDLVNGNSTNGGGSFAENVTFTIYLVVSNPLNPLNVTLDNAQRWTNAQFLDGDDTVILAGTAGVPTGVNGNVIANSSRLTFGGFSSIYWNTTTPTTPTSTGTSTTAAYGLLLDGRFAISPSSGTSTTIIWTGWTGLRTVGDRLAIGLSATIASTLIP